MDDHNAKLAAPSSELRAFVERFAHELIHERIEERRSPRHKLTAEVRVQPVDRHFEPTAAAFMAVTRDISTDGIGLMHDRAVRDKYLWLRLKTPGGKLMNVVVEVVRCRPLGKFYDIGGRFVAKLDQAPGFELPPT